MRYFNFTLFTSAEQIAQNSKVKVREYSYNNPVAAVNEYMYQNLKNGITFLNYREESNKFVLAAFAFNERLHTYEDAYKNILEILSDAFCINKVASEPVEVTMFQFTEYFTESRRRELTGYSQKIIDAANLLTYGFFTNSDKPSYFELEEKIINESAEKEIGIYDESFKKELNNIESHKNKSGPKGNMVHYIISARSSEAAYDMSETLVQKLYNANRISGRRIEIIKNIEPKLFAEDNAFESIIENNYGGTVLIDLSEKFGFEAVEYNNTCKYIERVVKKYRNECLFIFVYNTDNVGFSYTLLPELKKYIIPVCLREGTGNRNDAVSYMTALIKNSQNSDYASQTEEFLSEYKGDKFTQTDVMQAYEKFESWCQKKNFFSDCDYDLPDDFLLDRDLSEDSYYDKLQKMIGLKSVKKQIDDIIAANTVEKERKNRLGGDYKSGTMHMVFSGNPGTAKTTVAKLFAGIAKEKGILKSGAFVERGGMDLDGFGCVETIREAFSAAKGGVLFIDEAYSMQSRTAITVLLQEMENHREDVIVILAGYNDRMTAFMQLNEGLKSRIPYWIDFPDYDTSELTDIFKLMLKEKKFQATDDAVKEASYIFEKVKFRENFGNGRYVRNLIEHAIQNQSVRLLKSKENADAVGNEELFMITKDDICSSDDSLQNERPSGSAARELEEMIGLNKAKEIINKAIANFKLKKLCMDKGIHKDSASLHMVFTGNPGTAKTTVARLFAEILKDEKVLPTGNFIEVGRAELVGPYVGSTALLVKKKFREARGGVLFIDEAYSLCDGYENGYGDEAITTIVQEMENNRDNVIVIFAGYPAQMQQFLARNPGLSSRIAFNVEFEDYTTEELCEITELMLKRKNMFITDAAMGKLRNHYESVRNNTDYGNGRFVRKMLEEAEMNLAARIIDKPQSEITEQILSTIEEEDIPEVNIAKKSEKKTIGFIVD